jgi:Icc-related predicted phosphoesterase
VRILAFSDLHRDEQAGRSLVERSAQVDVVAGVGDFASMHHGLQGMIGVLSAIDRPALLVPGNNETDDALRAACAGWPAARVLHGEVAEIDDVTFFGLGGGVPVTPWDWSFDLTEQHAERMLTGLPPGAVLLVHSPPKGHVDGGLGSAAVLRAIQQRRPRLVLCGHVHECWGRESRVGDVPVRNLGPGGAVIELDAGASEAPRARLPRASTGELPSPPSESPGLRPPRSATSQSRRAPSWRHGA